MKKVIYLLLVMFMSIPCLETLAQTKQPITSKQARQMQRAQRQALRQAADQQAFQQAVQAIKEKKWVLMASTLYGPNGNTIPVSDNTNFIQFKDSIVYVQLAFNGYAGANGLGGITVQGTPSQMVCTTDKYGNITYSFYVNGIALTAQIVINLSNGNNYASATVYPMFNSNNLTFSGTLVPTSNSGIFRSGFISY
ncbi:MAG: DUF4251 domain-containing protein [Marinifilaceae bacterium]